MVEGLLEKVYFEFRVEVMDDESVGDDGTGRPR